MCWDEQKWPITIVIWVLGETHVKVQGYCAIPAPCGYKWLEMLRSLQCAMLCELLWYGWPTKILHHFGEFKHIKRSDNMIWWYNTKQTTSCKSYSLFLYLKWCLFFSPFCPAVSCPFFWVTTRHNKTLSGRAGNFRWWSQRCLQAKLLLWDES